MNRSSEQELKLAKTVQAVIFGCTIAEIAVVLAGFFVR